MTRDDHLTQYDTRSLGHETIDLTNRLLDDLQKYDGIKPLDEDALNAAVLYIVSLHTNEQMYYAEAARLTGALTVHVTRELPFIAKELHHHTRTHLPRPPLETPILEDLAAGQHPTHVRDNYSRTNR